MSGFRKLLAAAAVAPLAAALASGPARGQERPQAAATPSPAPIDLSQAPSFPAQIEQVNVDVVVTDKKGAPIPTLDRDDFTVLEDGKPQQVTTFERIVLPDAPSGPPPPPPAVSTNQDKEVRTGRTFVIVFDDIHMAPFQAHRAKAAVAEFLNSGVQEGDSVTLVATGGGAWWSVRMTDGRDELLALLKRLDGRHIPDLSPERMSDYEAMRIHVYHDTQVEQRVSRRFETYGVNPGARTDTSQGGVGGLGIDGDPLVRGRASEVYYQALTKNRITLEVVERVLSSLAGTRGRKSLVLVSEGFIYDPNMDEFKRVNEASRRANVAIYFVDTRGLGGISPYATAQFGPALPQQDVGFTFAETFEASEGSESLAADSGGFTVKNTNDLARGIKRIAEETRSYYLLGYVPTNTARDGRFRKIQVKVAAKGLEVRARKGYYAPLDGARSALDQRKKGGSDPAIQAALDSPFEEPAVPMRLMAHVMDETLLGKARVLVSADVDLSSFGFEQKEDRFAGTLEFLLVVAHRETGEFFRYDQKYEMNLKPETRRKLDSQWFPIARDFELAPGRYQAKLVVRDKSNGRIGTVIHNFNVPELSQFRTSSPVITDTLQPAQDEDDGRPKPAIVARRTFKPGSMLYCQFDVFGAEKDKESGMPRVKAGYLIQSRDGKLIVTGVAPTVIQPTSLGRVSRLVGTRLDDVPPGEYEWILNLEDELSGRLLQIREPFTVSG